MSQRIKRLVLVTALVALFASVVAAPAFGRSVSNRQIVPGWTTRTIWDSAQVAVYKLPHGVNHVGNIHMELRFTPVWADFDVYLLDANGVALSQEMGYMAAFTGKEVVDWHVTEIDDQTIAGDQYGGVYMVGDTYYVAVVAFNEQAKFQLWGYYPQIDLSMSSDTTAADNYYLQGYNKPISASKWVGLYGPKYGHPYDFTPTSEGTGEARLEWPADVAAKTVTYDPVVAPSPANMEQYMYAGSSWDTVFMNYDPVANWTPADQGGWYGLLDSFDVVEGGDLGRPHGVLHYVPSLYLVAADAAVGWPPKLGRRTMAYKATITWPENLRFISAPAKVRAGRYATLKGTFALNDMWAAGAKVKIQRNVGGVWRSIKTVTTDANGKWSAKVKITKTYWYRARAAGDDSTGLATEYSAAKRVRVTR